jgi:glycosyltransferase involved in cell wall biosynthesis
MQKTPVTVLLPVHNGAGYIRTSIDSVCGQSLKDFELLIVDDASTDDTIPIINTYNDRRIRILTNPENIGIARSLNRGIEEARGKFIARMDADDSCMPQRLEQQVGFMESNPGVELCGTWAQVVDSYGNPRGCVRPPHLQHGLMWSMLFSNPIVHTSTMFRTATVRRLGGYSTVEDSEDFELWSRLMHVGQIAVLPRVLVRWREHPGGYNTRHFKRRTESGMRSVRENLQRLLSRPVDISDARDLYAVSKRWTLPDPARLKNASGLLERLFSIAISTWEPDRESTAIIKAHYAGMLLFIASKLANTGVRESLSVFRNASANGLRYLSLSDSFRYIARLSARCVFGLRIKNTAGMDADMFTP